MSDPYATLDVPPDADAETIKRAYRAKARKTHPDKPGGDPEAFAAVSNVWMVLRDPERRARYDKDGSTDAPVDDRMARISQMLCALFDQLLQQTEDVDHVNLIVRTDNSLRDMRKKSLANTKNNEAVLKRVAKARKRLKYSGKGGDFIAIMLSQRIDAIRTAQHELAKELDAIDGAIEHLADYIYETEKRPPDPWGQSTRICMPTWMGNPGI